MNPIVESLTGTAGMTDQVIASDLLITAKTGVRNYAMAITETASPDVRIVLVQHLEAAMHLHEQITNYLTEHGWYQAYDIQKQIHLDMQNAQGSILFIAITVIFI